MLPQARRVRCMNWTPLFNKVSKTAVFPQEPSLLQIRRQPRITRGLELFAIPLVVTLLLCRRSFNRGRIRAHVDRELPEWAAWLREGHRIAHATADARPWRRASVRFARLPVRVVGSRLPDRRHGPVRRHWPVRRGDHDHHRLARAPSSGSGLDPRWAGRRSLSTATRKTTSCT